MISDIARPFQGQGANTSPVRQRFVTVRRVIPPGAVRVGLVLLFLASGIAEAAPPPIEDAIAHAASTGRPLVIEFGASWCQPCREFARTVLPDPAVKRALQDVDFVIYDIDAAPGDAAARRYRISAMPTFMVVGSDGKEVVRVEGLPRTRAVQSFLALLVRARGAIAKTSDLEAAVAARPSDARTRVQLAAHYKALGRRGDALVQLRAAIAIPNLDRALLADLQDQIDDVQLAEDRLTALVDANLAFVSRYPESPLASNKLAFLALSGRIPSAKLRDLAEAHLDVVGQRDLAMAIRAAVVAGAPDLAQLATTRLAAPESRLVEIELALIRGDRDVATRVFAEVCKSDRGIEHRCYALGHALDGQHATPIARLSTQAGRTVEALERPTSVETVYDLAELDDGEAELGNAIVRALRFAEERCHDLVRRQTYVVAMIQPAGIRGVPGVRIRLPRPDPDLETCLKTSLSSTVLPPGRRSSLFASMRIGGGDGTASKQAPRFRRDSMGSMSSELLIYATARVGSFDAGGMGARVTFDIPRPGRWRFVGSVLVEANAIAAEGFQLDGSAGLGYRTGRGAVWLTAGIGASDYGDVLAAAIEVPIDLRARVRIGRVEGYSWLQATQVLSSPTRSGGAAGVDELTVGLGAKFPVGGYRMFVGASYERRQDGGTGLLCIGVPLDRL